MSTTASRREAIRIATEEARRLVIARRESAAEAVRASYRALADAIAAWLREHAGPDGAIPSHLLGEFEAWLSGQLQGLSVRYESTLGVAFADVVATANTLRPAAAVGSHLDRVLRILADFTGADGLQLSDRIWRVNEATRRAVLDNIRNAILRGESARAAAMRLIAEGASVPAETSLAIQGAQAGRLGPTVAQALLTGDGSPLRNALRVTRTEIGRAYTEAYVASVFEHPDTGGVRFNLSPLHPRIDVCDMHARANLFGLGAGVYPLGAHPYPAHPETLSYLTVVFTDEITDEDRAGKQTHAEWLRGESIDVRQSVLGRNKAAAFDAGELLDTEIFATWRDVRARLGR